MKVACLGMQGPSNMPEDSRADASEQILPLLPQTCADALAAELRVWRLHSEISELARLTDRLFSAPEVRVKTLISQRLVLIESLFAQQTSCGRCVR